MTRSRAAGSVRRALLFHSLSTATATIAVVVASVILIGTIATELTRRNVTFVASTVAHAVVAPFRLIDFSATAPEARETALAEIHALIDEGVIVRAKIWRVVGDEVVVVYSDEPRIEGVRRPFDLGLAQRLDDGEVVLFEVPDDDEHRYEFGTPDLLEAFIGFEDAAGAPMRLELYLESSFAKTREGLLRAILPVVIAGPLVLGAATLPLALALARRLGQREAERRELLATALAASDRERMRLAARLHDGIIQNLASVGLTLDAIGADGAGDDTGRIALLSRASDLVESDLAELRSLLTELAPPDFEGSLGDALRDLADDLRTPQTSIALDVHEESDAAPLTAALLYRVARELVRNALEHGTPARVEVRLVSGDDEHVLTITDDGGGFDPEAEAPEGHLGLSLIRQAVIDSGGDMRISSDDDGTGVVVRVPERAATVAG